METIKIENKVLDYGPETPNELFEIINYFAQANYNLELLRFKFSDNWFFYKGSNHIAVHQKTRSGKISDRLLFIEL